MYGRTHTPEIRTVLGLKLKAQHRDPEFITAHRSAMAKPGVRQALSESAQKRIGPRNSFFGKGHSPETKAKIAKANHGRFRGPNGSNWQGGKTRLSALIRNSDPAVRWRKQVFERDKHICQACGKKGGDLQADHIHPLALLIDTYKVTNLDEAFRCIAIWDLNNGRTLCVPCHKETPSFAGKYQRNYKRKAGA